MERDNAGNVGFALVLQGGARGVSTEVT